MGFFAIFWTWLNGQLATYIGDNTARLASVLEPAIVTVATVYVMAWGYLHLTGKIDEPVVTGLKRILVMALILGVGLRLWLYNTLIVDTFYNAPAQLASAMVGGADPVGTIDTIWERGGAVAGNLWDKGGVLTGDFGFYLVGESHRELVVTGPAATTTVAMETTAEASRCLRASRTRSSPAFPSSGPRAASGRSPNITRISGNSAR